MAALFTRDPRGRLVSINEPGGGPAPRFFLGCTREAPVWAVRHDQPEELSPRLAALIRETRVHGAHLSPSDGPTPFVALLSRFAPVERIWTGPAYTFPTDLALEGDTVRLTPDNSALLRPHLPEWLGDVSDDLPMWASLVEGIAVSVCCSVRITDDAHEAGVETHPEFRGRGRAGCAVSAWAHEVRGRARTPLYSTSWDNDASLRVAQKMGLMHFGSDLHIT